MPQVPPQPAAATTVAAASSTATRYCFAVSSVSDIGHEMLLLRLLCIYLFGGPELSRTISSGRGWSPSRRCRRGGTDLLLERGEGSPPEVGEVQADRGQGGREELRLRDVVEAHDADVAGGRPAWRMALMTPSARSSFPQSTAVTAGSRASTWPAS